MANRELERYAGGRAKDHLHGATKAVNIKLLKLGGIQKNLAVVRVCEEAGLSCQVGNTGTSRLLEAAQAHFISATSAVLVPSELWSSKSLTVIS